MLGGVFWVDKKMIIKRCFVSIVVLLITLAIVNIDLLGSHFVFSLPWVFFCFLLAKYYGCMAMVGLFIGLSINDVKLIFIGGIVGGLLAFSKHIFKGNKGKLLVILSVYNLFCVILCGVLEMWITNNSDYLLLVAGGVSSYWIMRYLGEIYFVIVGEDDIEFDSRLISFILVFIGVILACLNVRFSRVNISFILILYLLFISVRIGGEVGAIYTLMQGLILYLMGCNYWELVLIGYTFVSLLFLKNISKVTLFFVYVIGWCFFTYYFSLDNFGVVICGIVGALFLFTPNNFIKWVCARCYGNEAYVKRICYENKKYNENIVKRILKMEEVFSLVCEKIDLRDRIKKNDKRLLAEEVEVFRDILKGFSREIENNYNFSFEDVVKREFYARGIDLLDFKINENVLGDKIVKLNVRCFKKEIFTLVIPLVNKIIRCQFRVEDLVFDDMFGFYRLVLKKSKKYNLKYGVRQKSLDNGACGDSYLVYESERLSAFAIGDGMGTGKKAKVYSKLALDLFRKFMDIGFDISQCLKSLNGILRDKYEKEGYSTLDLFVYDKYNEKFYFCKNGASDSFVIGEQVCTIRGNNPPIGIVEKFDVEVREVVINKGDLVIMASDGVGEIDFSEIKKDNLQKLSDNIVKKSLFIQDDKTVFVIKIC